MRPARALAIAAALLVIAGAAGAWRLWSLYVDPGPSGAPIQLVVPRGGEDTGTFLAGRGVIASPMAFAAGTRLDGLSGRLRAGEYLFAAGISARAAAELLAGGRTVQRRFTVAEGLTVAQVANLLRNAEGMEGDVAAPLPPEGSLLPETYFYSWGDARARTLERAQRSMRDLLAEIWTRRAADLPFAGPQEALVLASIVEKETSHADERARVAAVFVNRLRRHMRLQADPTVAYGIDPAGPLGRPLSRADLETRHPWNTYVIDGLPPTPIANPGRASIEAALNPAATDDVYFVADGEGRHVFARTLAEHNRNVARLREAERARATRN